MINRSNYIRILQKYLDGTISREEHDELFAITSSEDVDSILSDIMDTELNAKSDAGADLPPHISEDIIRNILISEKNTTRVLKLPAPKWKFRVAAAAIVFLALCLAFYLTGSVKSIVLSKAEPLVPKTNIKKRNESPVPYTVLLGDGSRVVLQPGASINYPVVFTLNKREVYLKGEASFTVSRNPARPFTVYYNNIVTQVLGTSFTLKTNPNTHHTEVSVKEGKVQVYENTSLLAGKEKVKGVIVTQNQKVIYYQEQRAFETTLSDSLQPIISADANRIRNKEHAMDDFRYTKPASLATIFKQLQDTYGIEILVENENLYNCLFTGDLSKQEVYKKLEILCLAVDAHFDIKGTRILVTGRGCN